MMHGQKNIKLLHILCVCVSVVLVIHQQSACFIMHSHLWPVLLCHIFPHYLINGTIFGKTLLNIKCET